METNTSPTQMSKPTEETETETTTSEELEQPPPEEVLVLHEDEELDTDPLRTLSDIQVETIYCTVQARTESVPRIDMTLQKADVPARHDGTNLQGGAQHSERAFSHDT